jgi:hypothetical protein
MNTIARGERGRWLPGQSGNPSGRPRVVREVQALAREHTPEVEIKGPGNRLIALCKLYGHEAEV